MKYKLLCIDIDGTLLDDNKKLLPQVAESLKKEVEKGVRIALISGRMPAGTNLIEQELGIQCIKACNAGSYILMGDRCISSRTLQPETMKIIYHEISKKNHLPLWIFREEKWFVTGIDEQVEKEIEIIRYEPQVVDVDEIASIWEREGEALREICKNLGIGRKEAIAFGDHQLDIPMIEAAGIGIAMGNAIPELKEKADFVTRTNNEAGISYALEHYLAGE